MPAKGAPALHEDARVRTALAVRLDGVSQRYGETHALADVTLDVAEGEVVAVVGPSGCGKSTLLDLVCGLTQPYRGTVDARPAVLMPQRDALLPWLSALDNAALPHRLTGASRDEARARARPVLQQLGLDGFEEAKPHELSGGMRQRVAFVRTLMAERDVLCLDEPFGALDAITRASAQQWLAEALRREPRTVLLVTHDVEEALVLADRLVVLAPRPGRVVADLPVVLERPRATTDPDLVALRAQALAALGPAT